MSREQLERLTSSLVVILLSAFGLGLIVLAGNMIFRWDLFPPGTEEIMYFILLSAFIVTMCAALINVMLNISRLAFFAKIIAERMHAKQKHE